LQGQWAAEDSGAGSKPVHGQAGAGGKPLKGQVAMEYLATYGWALFALFIVIAALIGSGIFNPGRFASEDCLLQPNMPCSGYYMYYDEQTRMLTSGFSVGNSGGSKILWRNASVFVPNKGGTLVGSTSIDKMATQGKKTNVSITIPGVEKIPFNTPKKARISLDFSVCEGYAFEDDCRQNAPRYTTSGRLDVVVRSK